MNQITKRQSRGDIAAMIRNAHSSLGFFGQSHILVVINCLNSTRATAPGAISRPASIARIPC
jgi:hypothetical protein